MLILILILALVIRLFLSQFGTYYNDLAAFQLWSLDLIRSGFNNFYSIAKSDYLPGYLYILWFTGKVFYFLNAHEIHISLELAYKMPSILADLVNGYLIFLITKRFISIKKATIASVFYLFNPVLLANSTLWGQNDSFVTIFILLSFYLLFISKYFLAFLILGLGYLVKPILIFSLPIFFIFSFLNQTPIKNIFIYLGTFISVVLLLLIPFNNTDNFSQFLKERHFSAASWFPYTTLNAFNFWAVISSIFYGTLDFVSDQNKFLNITFRIWGYFIFITIYSCLILIFIKKFKQIKSKQNLITSYILLVILIYFSIFLFLTQIRERHLYYSLTILTMLIPFLSVKYLFLIISSYFIYGLNLYYSFVAPSLTNPFLPIWIVNLLSLTNLVIFGFLFYIFATQKKIII